MGSVVKLIAIKFNHDDQSSTSDAINIRKNFSELINVPEWERGKGNKPEDSLAAYSIRDTSNKIITIQAKFWSNEFADKQPIEIRAVDPPVPPGPGLPLWLLLVFLWILLLWRQVVPFNVLGNVAPRIINFGPNGESDFVPFELHFPIWNIAIPNLPMKFTPIGVFHIEWRWQWRPLGGSWQDFDISRHRIYTILEIPKEPWQQTPGSTQLPWTDVLDVACNWASGALLLDDASSRITRSMNDLGNGVLVYDCPNGNTHYAKLLFNCSKFLELLKGGKGLGNRVNCTDCATIVSTFSNILGCNLWQSRMFSDMSYQFGLNPILAIGYKVWQTACNGPGFGYHEVAWKGNCTENDELFDACLQVDGDNDPTANDPLHSALLPTNMLFGNPGDMQYLDRLVPPDSRQDCRPQPTTRHRREII